MVKVIADIDLPKGLLNYSLRRKENPSVKGENCMQDESLALINFGCVLVDTGKFELVITVITDGLRSDICIRGVIE